MPLTSSDHSANFSFRLSCVVWQLTLFSVIYFLSNQYASKQYRTESLTIPLDATIPFIDWMIVPYSLSFPLFIFAFLLPNSRKELLKLSQRITLSTLIAGCFFYVYPLRFSMTTPEINTIWHTAYQWLYLFDQPYNQLPSLHVIYSLLFGHYLLNRQILNRHILNRHISKSGDLKDTSNVHLARFSHASVNFITVLIVPLIVPLIVSCIILSTLLTYQHHTLDVVTGGLIATALLLILRAHLFQPIAFFYTTLGIAWSLIVLLFPLPWFCFYPSVTFLAIGYAYATNSNIFHPKSTYTTAKSRYLLRFFLLPYQIIYWLMWRLQTQQPYHQITPYLYAGKRLKNNEVTQLPKDTYCIDLGCELNKTKAWRTTHYQAMPLLDLQPISFKQAFTFCRLADALTQQYPNRILYVHCIMGISRSYAMVACYLVYKQMQTAETVRKHLTSVNPRCVLPLHYLEPTVLAEIAKAGREKQAEQNNETARIVRKNDSPC